MGWAKRKRKKSNRSAKILIVAVLNTWYHSEPKIAYDSIDVRDHRCGKMKQTSPLTAPTLLYTDTNTPICSNKYSQQYSCVPTLIRAGHWHSTYTASTSTVECPMSKKHAILHNGNPSKCVSRREIRPCYFRAHFFGIWHESKQVNYLLRMAPG